MFGMVTALVVQEPAAVRAAARGTGAGTPSTVRAAAAAAGSTALMCRVP
jgi:hypothetical protein